MKIDVFFFSDLSLSAQVKAIDNYREHYPRFGWEDCVRECWIDNFAEVGINVDKMYYSVSFSQGDGASIDASVDVYKMIVRMGWTKDFRSLLNLERYSWSIYTTISHSHSSHYVHEKTMIANTESDYYSDDSKREKRIYGLLDEFNKDVLEVAKSMCRQFHKDLEDSYWRQSSDEFIALDLEQSDYKLFFCDGTPVPFEVREYATDTVEDQLLDLLSKIRQD